MEGLNFTILSHKSKKSKLPVYGSEIHHPPSDSMNPYMCKSLKGFSTNSKETTHDKVLGSVKHRKPLRDWEGHWGNESKTTETLYWSSSLFLFHSSFRRVEGRHDVLQSSSANSFLRSKCVLSSVPDSFPTGSKCSESRFHRGSPFCDRNLQVVRSVVIFDFSSPTG